MKNICVYTVITGNYDSPIEIKKEPNVEYLCYTNNKHIKSKNWNVIYVEDKNLSDIELSRKLKMLGTEELKKYDVTVYIDGSLTIVKSIKEFIKENVDLETYDLVGFKHSSRNTVSEECCACVYYKKESILNVKKLLDFYKKEKFEDDFGLLEANVLFRNFNNQRLCNAMQLWFEMYLKYSHRDQLTFPYVVCKKDLKVKLMNQSVWNNEYFINKPHYKVAKVKTTIFSFNKNKIIDIKEDEFEVNDSKLNLYFENVHKGMQYVVQIESDKNMTFDFIGVGKPCYDLIFQQCVSVKDKIYSSTKIAIIVLAKRNMKFLQVCFPISFSDDIFKLLDEVNNELYKSKNIIDYNEFLIQKGKNEFDILEYKYKELNEKYIKVVNSRGWKVLEKIRHTFKKH